MFKLLICTISGAVIALATLQLRQQRLELGYQTNELHEQIRDQQARLWNQQLQVAILTAPNAIRQTVDTYDLKMVPQSPAHQTQQGPSKWIDIDTPGAKKKHRAAGR